MNGRLDLFVYDQSRLSSLEWHPFPIFYSLSFHFTFACICSFSMDDDVQILIPCYDLPFTNENMVHYLPFTMRMQMHFCMLQPLKYCRTYSLVISSRTIVVLLNKM